MGQCVTAMPGPPGAARHFCGAAAAGRASAVRARGLQGGEGLKLRTSGRDREQHTTIKN